MHADLGGRRLLDEKAHFQDSTAAESLAADGGSAFTHIRRLSQYLLLVAGCKHPRRRKLVALQAPAARACVLSHQTSINAPPYTRQHVL
eukprot:5452623-Pleurochrysis_carterae.AAC.3